MSDFPDLSKPIDDVQASNYPDLSKPMVMDNKKDSSKKSNLDYLSGNNRTPLDTIRDITAGAVKGLGHGGQQLATSLTGGYAPDVTSTIDELSNQIASPNKSIGGGVAQNIGQYLPYGVAGGASLGGQVLAGGASGLANTMPNEQNLFGILPKGKLGGAIEGATSNALMYGLLTKLFPKQSPQSIDFKPDVFQPSTKSEFTNQSLQDSHFPEFLKENNQPSLSPGIAKNIHSNIVGGRNTEQSGKELASAINNNYQRIKNNHSDRYNDLFNSSTDDVNYFTDEPIKVKDAIIDNSKYKENYSDYDKNDKNIEKLHNEFIENPTVENAHSLQSELGSEIGYLSKQRSKGLLDSSGKNKLNDYSDMRSILKNEIGSIAGNKYDEITKSWEKNVIPYHSDSDLRSIAEGKIKNPTSQQVVSIFKNPEENIKKVASDLSGQARNRILHIGMGKGKFQNTPKDMLSGSEAIERKGLSNYVSPESDQLFSNLRSNIEQDKINEKVESEKSTIRNSLRNLYNESQKRSLNESSNSLDRYNFAQQEAQNIAKNKLDQAMKERQIAQEKRNRPINSLRYLLGGAAGAALTHAGSDSFPELAGFYVGGKNLLKKHGKH